MSAVVFYMAVLGAICLLVGVVIPAVAILFYPLYRKFGGKLAFWEYMEGF